MMKYLWDAYKILINMNFYSVLEKALKLLDNDVIKIENQL